MDYSAALINVFWSKDEINTRYFKDYETQILYFTDKVKDVGGFSPTINFNFNDGITSTIYIDVNSLNIIDMLHKNYLVLSDDGYIGIYRYYFAKVTQDSGNRVRVDLELDDIQTNYFAYKSFIKNPVINRACLNRFDRVNDSQVAFKSKPGSTMYINEDVPDLPKYIDFYNTCTLNIFGADKDEINIWLAKNVVCWVYCFLMPNNDYHFQSKMGTEIITRDISVYQYFGDDAVSKQDYYCVCYPILRGGQIQPFINFIDPGGWSININESGFNNFIDLNNKSFLISKKYSLVPPLLGLGNYSKVSLRDNTLTIMESTNYENSWANGLVKAYRTGVGVGVIGGFYQFRPTISTKEVEASFPRAFSKESIIGAARNFRFNPKISTSKFSNLTLKSPSGQTFIYEPLQLGEYKPIFSYSESINPGITRSYLRFRWIDNLYPKGLFESEMNSKNFLGLVENNDNSILFTNDKYSEFIANNKNFWLQSNSNIGVDAAKGASKALSQGFSGDIIKGINTGIETALNTTMSIANRDWGVDNLIAAPSSIKNGSGDINFTLSVIDMNYYAVMYRAKDADIKVFDDYIFFHGFKYGAVGNLDDFDHIRHFFNYLEVTADTILAPISDLEKKRLKEKLKAVRFFNFDIVNFELENFEEWLLN